MSGASFKANRAESQARWEALQLATPIPANHPSQIDPHPWTRGRSQRLAAALLGLAVAGGQAADSDEIYQEGLRIPPSKIYVADKPNDTLLRVIEHNTRVPNTVMGDVRAQLAALISGEAEILKLAETYSADELKIYMCALIDYTERWCGTAFARCPMARPSSPNSTTMTVSVAAP